MKIRVNPGFVKTRNVRNFENMMDGLGMATGEGRLAVVSGKAGRGKTRTSQWWSAGNKGVYILMASVWRSSESEFLQAFCRELGVEEPPGRKGMQFAEIVTRLSQNPVPVFLDEIDKYPMRYREAYLHLVRDITECTGAPIIMIGEETLISTLKRNQRVWSRVYQRMEFEPINQSDIIAYTSQTTGLKIAPGVAGVLHKSSMGDFRIVRRDMISMVQIYNSLPEGQELSVEIAEMAVRSGLKGGDLQ